MKYNIPNQVLRLVKKEHNLCLFSAFWTVVNWYFTGLLFDILRHLLSFLIRLFCFRRLIRTGSTMPPSWPRPVARTTTLGSVATTNRPETRTRERSIPNRTRETNFRSQTSLSLSWTKQNRPSVNWKRRRNFETSRIQKKSHYILFAKKHFSMSKLFWDTI